MLVGEVAFVFILQRVLTALLFVGGHIQLHLTVLFGVFFQSKPLCDWSNESVATTLFKMCLIHWTCN